MQRRVSIIPVFFLFLILSLIIFFASQKGIWGGFEQVILPVQRLVFNIFHISGGASTEDKLREENELLRTQLAKQKELEKENRALHDQFQITNPSPKQLLPAEIIGQGNGAVIIDRGSHDKVKVGQVVIVRDNIVGIVIQVSTYRSVVRLITNEKTSFTAQAVKTGALGVVYGRGESIIFGNVVLSDSLEKDDIVTTRGDVNSKGEGFPPDLVVGKIVSINKRASSLFQTAEVKSLVDFEKLEMVFVLVGN